MVMKHTDWKGHGIWEQASHSDDSHINIRDNNYNWGRDTTGYECCNSINK